ncbi:dihydrofolate reductase [Enterococcus villorum]|uniref:Dihydrofolate reductase n=2 Tax=Enterococcus villorum TaxID=112904 RepID=A0A511J049_9ENTE|nr:dihydrofolate reductase [Enterococcus villorum]EOH87586.1 dihydrofolate reductase [Enterococcus villorum ATCC 700913]EOW77695.1 dihydrofolate reductase [Enterococcus villorum ATCC 700913]GEL91400.1 dihydrofolate reductase [Enterococcus villorum]
MFISMWAQDRNGLIGKDGLLPWRLPNDMRFFREHTMNKILVMGRKTYEGMGELSLPYRHIIVLTTQKDFKVEENAEVFHSIEELLMYAKDVSEDIYVSGGSQIFQDLLPETGIIWRTLIDGEFEGDTYIGEIDFSDFELVEEHEGIINQENRYAHRFQKWQKKQ